MGMVTTSCANEGRDWLSQAREAVDHLEYLGLLLLLRDIIVAMRELGQYIRICRADPPHMGIETDYPQLFKKDHFCKEARYARG